MKINGRQSIEVILQELGNRIKERRIAMAITQENLAKNANISTKTVSNVERGESISTKHLVSILKVLRNVDNLNNLIPDSKANPFDILELGHKRQRVHNRKEETKAGWVWGDNE